MKRARPLRALPKRDTTTPLTVCLFLARVLECHSDTWQALSAAGAAAAPVPSLTDADLLEQRGLEKAGYLGSNGKMIT